MSEEATPILERRGVRIALVVVAVALVVRALLPLAAEWGVERALSDATGWTARVDDVDLGLFAGTVAIEGLSLGGTAPAETGAPEEAEGAPEEAEDPPEKAEGAPEEAEDPPEKAEGAPEEAEDPPEEAAGAPDEAVTTAEASGATATDAVAGARATPPLLAWRRLIVDLRWLGLLSGRIQLAAVALEGPAVRLELDEEGRIQLPPPDVPASSDSADAPSEPDGEPESKPVAGPEPDGEPESKPVARPEPEAGTDPETPVEPETGTDPMAPPEPETGTDPETPPEPETGTDAETPEAGGWPILVDRLSIDEASLRVADPRAAGPALELAFRQLQLTELESRNGAITLGGIALRDPRLRAERSFLLERPAEEPEAAEEPAPEDGGGDGAVYRAESIALESGEFTLLTDAGRLEASIVLTASQVSTSAGARFPFRLEIAIDDGSIVADGELGLAPAGFAGKVRWTKLPLPPLVLAGRPDLMPWVRQSHATGELEIDMLPETPGGEVGALRASGRTEIVGMRFEQPGDGDLSLRWKTLVLVLRDLALPLGGDGSTRPLLALSEVRLVDPHLRYVLPSTALDELLGSGGGSEGGSEQAGARSSGGGGDAAGGPSPRIVVDRLAIDGGRALVVDRTVDPDVRARVRELDVTARRVAPAGPAARPIEADGRTIGGAGFSLSGRLGETAGELRFDLDRLALPPLNPYVVEASGYRVRGGDLSLGTEARVEESLWRLDNRLVLHDLRVKGEGGGGLDRMLGMPTDLAIALLKDVGGDISLSIPVTFAPEGLQVGLAPILRDALRGAVAGAITSPLKVMGAALDLGKDVVQGNPLRVDPIAFRPGEAELAADMAEEVEALALMLERHPLLRVVLTGRADPEADRPGVALDLLAERALEDRPLPDVGAEDAGYFDRRNLIGALEDRARGRPMELDDDERRLLDAWIAAVEVPAERFDALARRRAEMAGRKLLALHEADPRQVRPSDVTGAGAPSVSISFEALEED